MSDFLKNLRGSHKRETPDLKKNLDSQFYQNERKKIPYRRPDHSETLESLMACIIDTLPRFLDSATNLTQHLEKKLNADGLLTEAKIRQYNSVSGFFDHLSRMIQKNFATVDESDQKSKAEYIYGTHYTKDEILSLIRDMRKKEATFAAIADHLKEKGIPTFSGRGEWHAQTIHRLCK